VPLNFFPIDHAKHYFEGLAFSSCRDLLAAILQVLTDISIENLYAVLRQWIERLEWTHPKTGTAIYDLNI
jgi:hypothetical protein